MILFPTCKINLGLNILFKRNDGYHEIDTCMYEIPMYDILEFIPSENFEFTSSGLVIPGDNTNNLCVKAFQKLKNERNIPNVKIHLHKQIPMGGGLGGGSSDGTYTFSALNNLFNLNLSDKELENYASQIGSDCPFFVKGKAQISRGRGELLEPIDLNLQGYFIKILNIGIHVSTAEAYSNVNFVKNPTPIKDIVINQRIEDWKINLKNQFEYSVFKKHPVLQTIKDLLYTEGAIYASMSGSGSTMYGIYKNKPSENTFSMYNPQYETIISL
jgi:4-diphosphocytidyl-2-C-methyl-D-erythritol kinase